MIAKIKFDLYYIQSFISEYIADFIRLNNTYKYLI